MSNLAPLALPGEAGRCHNTGSTPGPNTDCMTVSSTASSTASQPSATARCCRCNGSAKCLRCACVNSGSPCSHCLPGEAGRCHNTLPLGSTLGPPPISNPAPTPIQSCQPPNLPTLESVLGTHIFTLHHVPKGARDSWAASLGVSLSSIVANPLDSSLWLKLLMLAKCILANPAAGHRLRWREILKLVKSRIRRWNDGDYLGLWSEAVENSQAASRRKRPMNLLKQNAKRALHAAQNGQYSKAINLNMCTYMP